MNGERSEQYMPPVPGELADRILEHPECVGVLDALDWNDVSAEELFAMFPGSVGLVDMLVEAGAVVLDDDGRYRLSGPFQNNSGFSDMIDVEEILLSEKRNWGDAMGEMLSLVAHELVGMVFGREYDRRLMERVFCGDCDKIGDAADRVIGVLVGELSGEGVERFFERCVGRAWRSSMISITCPDNS